MTTIAVSTETPTIVCPSWCTTTYAEHLASLSNLEGFVIHHGALDDDVRFSRLSYVDGAIDPSDPPLLYVERNADGITLEDAEQLAQSILAAVKEARA